MSKYIHINGKVYKEVDSEISGDAKKGAALAQKILKDVKSANLHNDAIWKLNIADHQCGVAINGLGKIANALADAASK